VLGLKEASRYAAELRDQALAALQRAGLVAPGRLDWLAHKIVDRQC
jgi:hypothetical protein